MAPVSGACVMGISLWTESGRGGVTNSVNNSLAKLESNYMLLKHIIYCNYYAINIAHSVFCVRLSGRREETRFIYNASCVLCLSAALLILRVKLSIRFSTLKRACANNAFLYFFLYFFIYLYFYSVCTVSLKFSGLRHVNLDVFNDDDNNNNAIRIFTDSGGSRRMKPSWSFPAMSLLVDTSGFQ